MICPSCRAPLPFRFALHMRGAVNACPECRTEIAPTADSLRRAGLLIYVPAAVAAGVLIPVGTHYAKRFDNWTILLAVLLMLILGITAWGVAVSTRVCEFRKV
jgi:hypothetical protein